MLKKEGTPDWVFKECQDLNNMTFRFKDKEKPRSFTCNSAGSLHVSEVFQMLAQPCCKGLMCMCMYMYFQATPKIMSSGSKTKKNQEALLVVVLDLYM
jgi:hypothetical protein